jgi:hypothetical protein
MVQGTLLQQSARSVQIWPYSEQGGVPPVPWPPAPPVPGDPPVPGGVVVPQIPWVDPGARMHSLPGQQSPLMVQVPPTGTQFGPPSFGGRQRSTPFWSGTQGRLLQQSIDEAQVSPACRHWSPSP